MLVGVWALLGCSTGDYEVTKGGFGAGPGGADEVGDDGTGGETEMVGESGGVTEMGPGTGETGGVTEMGTGGTETGGVGSTGASMGGCGDGKVDANEACDDGDRDDEDGCRNDCSVASCGDGVTQAGVEQCDTGGASQQCNANCTLSMCGDSVVNVAAGEQCDTAGASASCDADCTSVVCGDGTVNAAAGEQCDDGNAKGGDGCSASCQMEASGPKKCDVGNDPGTGAPWVVCTADANMAWLSSNPEGSYHPVKICQNLGYKTVGQWGGTAGSVCGVKEMSSCQSPGKQVFSEGAWSGMGNCGEDALGPMACKWVQWTCVK